MIKLNALLFTIIGLFISCKDGGNSIQGFDQNDFNLKFPVGEKRIIYRSFAGVGKNTDYMIPSIGIFEIVKDTVFNGSTGKIISVSQFEYANDSVYEYSAREVLVQEGKQINIYEYKNSNNTFLFGLFKKTSYDTLIFIDKMTVLDYPLTINKKWKMRPIDDPNGNWSIEKEFVNIETVMFGGQKYQCDVFVIHSIVDLKSWISIKGLLKAEINYGASELVDSSGKYIDSVTNTEVYELLKINPTETEIDSIKIKYKGMAKLIEKSL